MTNDNFKPIEFALSGGAELRAFRSGGGLRVVRVERDGVLLGYGEYPDLEGALGLLVDDLIAGGRDYGDVYRKTTLHYLTGSSSASSPLDAYLLRGGKIRASWLGRVFRAVIETHAEVEIPKHHRELCREGKTVYWASRGVVYRSSACSFGGSQGVEVVAVSNPGGRDDFFEVTKTGHAPLLPAALDKALAAPEVEVRR